VLPGLAAINYARRYRLAETRASALLLFLDAHGELLGAEGQTELTFEQLRAAAGQLIARVTLRFRVGQEFGELQVIGPDGRTSDARIYAAGPIERILHAIGFREVSRALVVARRYRFQGAEVRVAHVKPLGWFCEVRPGRGEDLSVILAGLGVAQLAEAHVTEDELARSEFFSPDRRRTARRATERRSSRIEFAGQERRGSPDQRVGDRRLTALT